MLLQSNELKVTTNTPPLEISEVSSSVPESDDIVEDSNVKESIEHEDVEIEGYKDV